MMSFRHLTLARAAFAALVMLAAALTPAAAQTSVKFALEGSIIGPYAPFLLAEDRGYYRAEALDVTIEAAPSPPDAIARVANGLADAGRADLKSLARFLDANPGAQVKAVFIVYNRPPYAMITRKSRGVTQPRDLEGKRIGAPPGEMASLFLPAFLKLNGLEATKVKIEQVAAAIREPMLAAGQIDAVTGTSFNAYLDLKERSVPLDDLVVLSMADYGLPLYGDAVVVNTAFAAAHPEAVKGLLRAVTKGLREAVRSPTRAIESVMKRNEAAKKDVELERLRMAIRDNILTEETQVNGLGGIDTDRFARGVELLTQVLKPKAKIGAADLFDASFLPSPTERRIGTARPG
jgi:NitT/TauT family transport system substrate-binding protein